MYCHNVYHVYLLLCIVLYFYNTKSCKLCAEQTDKILKETFECKSNRTVGLTVSVVRSGEVLFVGGYGVRDEDTKTAVTGDTVFQIASLTKAFASTLLVKLIEEKTKYTLNSRIKTILNNNNIFYDSLRSNYVTVRDLLSHRTGIPKYNRIRFNTNLTRSNLIQRLKYLKPRGEFRGSYIYNNLMYGVVTYLAEVIGGDSWENLVRKHLFNPLGMTSSTFVTKADPSKIQLARGYIEYYGELHPVPFEFSRFYGELCGSTCILTTARDMTKWVQFYLNGGKLGDGTRLISEKAFNHITNPKNPVTVTHTKKYFTRPKVPVTHSQTGYALGWRTGHYRGYRMFIHTGSTFGYRALLSWYPDADLGIFIALTGNDPNYLYRTILQNYIFDLYTGQSPYLNSSTICSFPEPWLEKIAPKSKPVYQKDLNLSRSREDYLGIYHNPAYGSIIVKEHMDNNKLTLVYGYVSFELYPKSKDEFYGSSIGISKYLFNFYTFEFSFSGNVTLEIPNFESIAPIFKRKQDKINGANHSSMTSILIVFLVFISLL